MPEQRNLILAIVLSVTIIIAFQYFYELPRIKEAQRQEATRTEQTVEEALLSPTRTYAPVVHRLLDECRPAISGLIHCTGGGQTKCLSFGRGLHYVKDSLFETPPVFRAIREAGAVDDEEMLRVFNMGHRMEAYCDADAVDRVQRIAADLGVAARVVGRVEAGEPGINRLTIRYGSHEHRYEKLTPAT